MKNTEGYSELCQTSKMEHFAKIVNGSEKVVFFVFCKIEFVKYSAIAIRKKEIPQNFLSNFQWFLTSGVIVQF